MNIDIHAHYVPPDSLKVATEIGQRRIREIADQVGEIELFHTLGSLRAAAIDDEPMSRIASANACKLLRIGI